MLNFSHKPLSPQHSGLQGLSQELYVQELEERTSLTLRDLQVEGPGDVCMGGGVCVCMCTREHPHMPLSSTHAHLRGKGKLGEELSKESTEARKGR